MSSVCTVSDKGQVTLPKALRDQLGIAPGTRLQFSIDADGQLRAQVLSRGATGLFGLLAKPGERARSLDEMDVAVGHAVKARNTGRTSGRDTGRSGGRQP